MQLKPSTAAAAACILEASARKPGNVHRFRDFADAGYVEFLLSAAAIAPLMERARQRGVGKTILKAVRRTRELARTNTNLGIILLLVPLAAVPDDAPLNMGITRVLNGLTHDDARQAYRAIRLARPGGLGTVAEQDVAGEPTVTLRDAMILAAERDNIARQYANGFCEVFEVGVPALADGLRRGWTVEETIIGCHLQLMAALPDSLIARKCGRAEAEESARRASVVLQRGWPAGEGQAAFAELDDWLCGVGHERNPGAAADLAAASLYVALRQGTMLLPFDRPWSARGDARMPPRLGLEPSG